MDDEGLFAEALKRPPADRAAFLHQACAGRPELLKAIEALLTSHERWDETRDTPRPKPGQTADICTDSTDAHGTMDHAPPPEDATLDHTPTPVSEPARTSTGDEGSPAEARTVIAGRYTLERLLGEGGMGEVWVARQTEPVRRNVALKLIKAGMDSQAVLDRFDLERQALAIMDHPNIARVLDGGLTPTGHPFFVMELVDGLPLTRFCDEARLTPRERLELFVPICQAVQHAHQKGIVHRDLKPANILVTVIDGRPVPKVIDFGVAKAVEGKLTDVSMATQFGSVIGTLEYMAPEQAGFPGGDIDTRADVYSLGVILYELLTGLRPIDPRRLREAALIEMIRLVRDEEPSKPSTRLSTHESLPSLAALRQIDPRKLTALLRGELDWVVMKCLEKRRDRRYETANGLARDIQRYLADEPVEARPPSTGYRIGKFLRRHRRSVVAAGLLFLALVGGIIGTSVGMVRASRAAGAERAAKDLARKQLSQIQKANEILGSIFASLDPHEIARAERPLQAILSGKLQTAAEQLEGESIGDPLVVLSMQQTLGESLIGLGESKMAIPLLEKALAKAREQIGPDDLKTLKIMHDLGSACEGAGRLDRSVSILEEALRRLHATVGPDHPGTMSCMNSLAHSYYLAKNYDLSRPLFQETARRMKVVLGPNHPQTLHAMSMLLVGAPGEFDRRRNEKNIAILVELVKGYQDTLGPDDPKSMGAMYNLAREYNDFRKFDLAVPLYREVIALRKAKLGPDHPDTLMAMDGLGHCYVDMGKLDLAQSQLEEALKLEMARLGPDHQRTRETAEGLEFARSLAGAEQRYRETLKSKGPDHIETLLARRDLLQLDLQQGKVDQGEPVLIELINAMKSRPAKDPIRRFTTMMWQFLLEVLEAQAPGSWKSFQVSARFGADLIEVEDYARAERVLRTCYDDMKARAGTLPPESRALLRETAERLVRLHEATGKKDQADGWRKEAEAQGSGAPAGSSKG